MSDLKNVVVLSNHRETRDDAAEWSPREALLDLLQEIDNGLEVHELVISYDLGKQGTGFKNCTVSSRNAIGLLEMTKLELHRRGTND